MSDENPTTQQPERQLAANSYNTVFERLRTLADGNMLSASVAYSLYKESKREWIIDFRETNGRPPWQAEVANFANMQTLTTLGAFISQANQVLATYAQSVIDDERPAIQRDALKGTFWGAVWPSVVASFIFGIALLFIGLIAAYSGFGFPVQITVPPRS